MQPAADPKQEQQKEARERTLVMISWLINAIVPIIAFSAALVFVQAGIEARWPMVVFFRQPIQFPYNFYQLGVMGELFKSISRIEYLKVILVTFATAWIIFAGLFSILNAWLYKSFGPSLYSNVDVPTTKVKN